MSNLRSENALTSNANVLPKAELLPDVLQSFNRFDAHLAKHKGEESEDKVTKPEAKQRRSVRFIIRKPKYPSAPIRPPPDI